jgi:hypothetical protein
VVRLGEGGEVVREAGGVGVIDRERGLDRGVGACDFSARRASVSGWSAGWLFFSASTGGSRGRLNSPGRGSEKKVRIGSSGGTLALRWWRYLRLTVLSLTFRCVERRVRGAWFATSYEKERRSLQMPSARPSSEPAFFTSASERRTWTVFCGFRERSAIRGWLVGRFPGCFLLRLAGQGR